MNEVAAIDVSTNAWVLGTLAVALAASSVTLWLLLRRMTSHRRWVTLSEWCRESGFRLRRAVADGAGAGAAPAPFAATRARPRLWLGREPVDLLQLDGDAPPGGAADAAAETLPGMAAVPRAAAAPQWNVLVRRTESEWRPTALRPTDAKLSVIDLFDLPADRSVASTTRFEVHGKDPAAARLLWRSQARALLPADVGLLLHGRHLVLDFTSRPFDGIEFARMIALAEQLVGHLPAPAG